MKNLPFAIRVLSKVHSEIEFNVYGPLDDERSYGNSCLAQLKQLPRNVTARYCGEIPHTEVIGVLAKHDLFFLPSKGENFGHAILESLHAGCPPLISDRTPWQDLQKRNAGWVLPLQDEAVYCEAIENLAAESEEARAARRRSCREYARTHSEGPVIDLNRKMFLQLCMS